MPPAYRITNEVVLGTHEDEHLSAGQVLKAMILNGLGFVSAPMYLFGRFFEDKPTEHLLGEGVHSAHLNDDKLGRVLDSLHEAGLSSLFVEIASEAMSRLGVDAGRLHLETPPLSTFMAATPANAKSKGPTTSVV